MEFSIQREAALRKLEECQPMHIAKKWKKHILERTLRVWPRDPLIRGCEPQIELAPQQQHCPSELKRKEMERHERMLWDLDSTGQKHKTIQLWMCHSFQNQEAIFHFRGKGSFNRPDDTPTPPPCLPQFYLHLGFKGCSCLKLWASTQAEALGKSRAPQRAPLGNVQQSERGGLTLEQETHLSSRPCESCRPQDFSPWELSWRLDCHSGRSVRRESLPQWVFRFQTVSAFFVSCFSLSECLS